MMQATNAQGTGPGMAEGTHGSRRSYVSGLLLALVLTGTSFWAASTSVVYPSAVPILLGVLAIAQMGVHIVFFLHVSSAPDQTNNLLSLAFGIFVVALIVFGSLLIMADLSHSGAPMHELMRM